MPSGPKKINNNLPENLNAFERCSLVYTEDRKLWVVSRKGVNQPSVNGWHETPLQGGVVMCFDLNTGKWELPIAFMSLSDEEMLEGKVVGCQNSLLLLTYRKGDKASFIDAYEWKNCAWEKVKLELDSSNDLLHNMEFIDKLFVSTDAAGRTRLAISTGYGMVLATVTKNGDIVKIGDASKVNLFSSQGKLVKVAISGDRIYGSFGVHGCGFMWMKDRYVTAPIGASESELIDMGNDHQTGPRWGWSGPHFGHLITPTMWCFFGGSIRSGMTDSIPDHTVWYLDLERKCWEKIPFDVPADVVVVGDRSSDGKPRVSYAVSTKTGDVYEMSVV